MPRWPYPALLMLAMSLPGAARALGPGDIRVNSALNEPLSAQIALVGASPEELLTLTARLADEAMFHRYEDLMDE
jgi:pilus assembly protein FimV